MSRFLGGKAAGQEVRCQVACRRSQSARLDADALSGVHPVGPRYPMGDYQTTALINGGDHRAQ